jgi:hypothetical protein
MAAVAIAAAFTACLVGLFRSVGWLRAPIDLAPSPTTANTDHDLFDIVLTDLIGELRPAGGGTGPTPFQILISDRTRGSVRKLEEALGERIKDVPAEIRADLVHRNRERTHYSLAR